METKEFQRWTARRKVELLLQLIQGQRKLVDVCREHVTRRRSSTAVTGRSLAGGSRGRAWPGARRRRWRTPRDRRIEYGQVPLTLRSDNGLLFGAKVFVNVVCRYGLDQEYITPYSPEQNRMMERFFR